MADGVELALQYGSLTKKDCISCQRMLCLLWIRRMQKWPWTDIGHGFVSVVVERKVALADVTCDRPLLHGSDVRPRARLDLTRDVG